MNIVCVEERKEGITRNSQVTHTNWKPSMKTHKVNLEIRTDREDCIPIYSARIACLVRNKRISTESSEIESIKTVTFRGMQARRCII